MNMSKLQSTVLAIAGFTAVIIGSYIALDPHGFYSSYGIDLEGKVDLLSELRAPGTNLAVLGCVMLAGLFKPHLRSLAIMLSLSVFFAFSSGRLLGIALDGLPSEGIQAALAIELVIAGLCFFAFVVDKARMPNARKSGNT